jgi:CO/xanthine dehydrogenase FAD-binding subunit
MPNLKYLRPKTLDEALDQLASGVALGGGTTLAPRRHSLDTVVDLQDLGLSDLEVSGGKVVAGAGCTLQQIVEAEGTIAEELAEACRREAGWNLRNMATLAGAVLACDGRSPLATALLAMGARAVLAGGETIDLDDLLDRRPLSAGTLVTALQWKTKATLRYEQVARSPADRPLVAAAVGHSDGSAYRVVLAGFGARPIRVPRAEKALAGEDPRAAGEAAAEAYAQAGDVWASAEYRSHVAAVLVRRLASVDKVPSDLRDKVPSDLRDKVPSDLRDKVPSEPREKG